MPTIIEVITILTFQDFEAAEDKAAFILKAINEHKTSDNYRRAVEAQAYYLRKNTAIVNRMTFMEKYGVRNSKIKFFKIRSGFFARSCKQLVGYLLGNGVTLPPEVKQRLGNKFDRDLSTAGLQALVDGVNWVFWNTNRAVIFRVTEFVPLFDETNGELMAGIRFWQIDREKPLIIELYEVNGITKYVKKKDSADIALTQEQSPYTYKVRIDGLGQEVIGDGNYNHLPIFPFYANESKTSELSDGFKEDIDAHDFISSDLVDGITTWEGVWGVIKNYGGDDLSELRQKISEIKMLAVTDESDGDVKSVEFPHQAKQVALDLRTQSMFDDTMTLNMGILTGGSLTNVAINVSKTDFDLKADYFEQQATDVVENILSLLGIDDIVPKFKRRTLTNDTEHVNNITSMSGGLPYVDVKWAIENNPLIADEDQEELLKRMELEHSGVPLGDRELDGVEEWLI